MAATKKLFSIFILTAAITLSLASCTSKEVKSVVSKINELSEITLESGATLTEIENEYNALSDREKEQVDNIAVLTEAKAQYAELQRQEKNESILKSLDESLRNLSRQSVANKSELEEKLDSIERLYESLDDDFKSQATSYNNLNTFVANAVVTSVTSLSKNLQTSAASTLLSQYKDYLSDSQKLSCLGNLGLWTCVWHAETTLNRINSGKSYNISGIDVSCRDEAGNRVSYTEGTNQVEGTFNISGTNYFGGPYTSEIYLFYTFDIDIENCTVTNLDGFTY